MTQKKQTDIEIMADVVQKWGNTHDIQKVWGTRVVLSDLPEGVSVCYGDGETYHFQLTKKDLTPKCKCGGDAVPGQALSNTLTGYEDFGGDAGSYGSTLSRSGPAKMVDCLKCTVCGHSWVETGGAV